MKRLRIAECRMRNEKAKNNSAIRTPHSEIRMGFTTGTCAQAAAKAACLMLFTKVLMKTVEIETPAGIKFKLGLIDAKIGDDFARCAVVKDAGSDPDVTDGARIYAEARLNETDGITIKGGQGVGRVTKPGLAVGVGEWAINPVPRKMILREASKFLPKGKGGLEVTISVPDGLRLAKRTFNPKLGIVGGISIIGTTGIVLPKSQDAYKASLSLQLDMLKALKIKRAVLVLGYVGERFARETLKADDDSIIKIGDHVGFMLKECARKKIKEVFLIGHIGKLIKVANGQFNTNIKFGDKRIETISAYARKRRAEKEVIESIKKQVSCEAVIDILREHHLEEIFYTVAQDVVARIDKLTNGRLKTNCIILSLKGDVLGCYPR